MSELTFLVPGHDEQSRSGTSVRPSELAQATTTRSLRLDVTRGAGALEAVKATPGTDIVMLDIANGPQLYLHPENARDLFLAQQAQRPGQRGATDGHVAVPLALGWPDVSQAPGQARGVANVVTQGFELLAGHYTKPVAGWASSEIVRRVDAQVEPGLYALGNKRPGGQLKDFAHVATSIERSPDPVLVLIHGTFSSTYGTFSRLWDYPQLVDKLFRHYGKNVYALEHWTLAASPIDNALDLAQAVPDGTRLHLLTHSRGGLVAEVLARACGAPEDMAAARTHFGKEGYAGQLDKLLKLLAVVKAKNLQVERVVRVACPARGTLLASKRLDAYLSVLKWTLELARIPVIPALVEFLGAVAQHRTDPGEIPGLAAQMPDSPLVGWLHAAETPVPGELRVVAGDVVADSIGSWIKTLVSDVYYWQDNDFVVQTSSMYGGVPRQPDATFVLARAGDVSHFSYFARADSAAAIVEGLTAETPSAFARIGPDSRAGKSSTGSRGGEERPAVIVLPGILGSNLKVGDKRVWLSMQVLNGLQKLSYEPDNEVEPDGPIHHTYGDLVAYLGHTHDVIEFAYDWRVPLQKEAERLAKTVLQALAERREQPVRIVAHSMGGLLARVFQLAQRSTWDAMFSRKGARLLMLGTPNGGSWAPMQVLSGDDDFCNWLTLVGAPFAQGEARKMMASFPGLLQMQAGLLDPGLKLDRSETWKRLADLDEELLAARSIWHRLQEQLKVLAWGIPPQAVLNEAVALRRALDAQAAAGFGVPSGALVMVVGHAEFTPDGFESGKDGIVYREAVKGGDGRVTLPAALLPGVTAWRVDRAHGDLPRAKDAYDAYLELLLSGSTGTLPLLGAEERGGRSEARAVVHVLTPRRMRIGRAVRPDDALRFDPTSDADLARTRREPVLEMRVIHGNLKFVGHPVLVGHYSSSQLTGTERALDDLIGGAMSATLGMGCYPNTCGAHQIFANAGINPINPVQQMPRPQAIIVVGLGLEGVLTVTDLTRTVTQGVIAWAQRLRENVKVPVRAFEIAATLIGSGGVNMSAESSARAVAQGIVRANARLRALSWPTVACLDIVEVYRDRAAEALRALNLLADAEPDRYDIQPEILEGIGPQRRAVGSGYRGAHYDLISALQEENADGSFSIVYSLNSRRAREDVHASRQQVSLIDLLIRNAAINTSQCDSRVGSTLFKLLVPPEIEPFLTTSEEMQIELNDATAAIPWELLDNEGDDRRDADAKPWAIRSKLLRCLRTVGLPLTVNDAPGDAHFLVIGEPENLPPEYAALPGARREAETVAATLEGRFGTATVMRLISGCGTTIDAAAVVGALFLRDWRIVHISGHGALPDHDADDCTPNPPGCTPARRTATRSRGGVVLSDKAFLGADEISAMRIVPALVFVNCCHLGNLEAGKRTLPPGDMPRYAASVAEALIRKGVRCVLVAGWAVDDDAARAFAESFYQRLIEGRRFIDAVADARAVARAKGGNTWAAYQCYGDPNWTLTSGAAQGAAPDLTFAEADNVVSPSTLVVTLESLITSYQFEGHSAPATHAAVDQLETKYAQRWGDVGNVAQAFGMAHLDLNDYDGAVRWLERAVAANDGTASLHTAEQLASVKARQAWRQVREASGKEHEEGDAIAAAHERLESAIDLLRSLCAIGDTSARHALLGSAYKRLAMVLERQQPSDLTVALKKTIQHYTRARELAEKTGQPWIHPAANARIAQMVLDSRRGAVKPPFPDDAYRSALAVTNRDDPDFFNTVGQIEVLMYNAIAEGKLFEKGADILEALRLLYLRARGSRFWGPVLDQFDFVDRLWGQPVQEQERGTRRELREFLAQCQI